MTTPILDIAKLTSPLDGEQSAGVRLPADVRKKMEDARKDFEPDPDDPSKPPIPKKPDWSAIIKLSTERLGTSSRDLLAAVRLVEALGKRDHFAGLREGFELLRVLVTDCWDRIHPIIEGPEDLESRAGPFQWLADAESGAWFPTSIRKFPLLRVSGQVACLQDCQNASLNGSPLTTDMVRVADPATETIIEDVAVCLQELETLDHALVEKMADQSPALGNLRDVLSECKRYLSLVASSSPEEDQESSTESGDESSEGRTPSGGARGTSRADIYRQLAQLADSLARMEPHSPIPDLLHWAVKLGNMPFRQLILEFVREPSVVEEIRRQFGIKEAEGSGDATQG